MTQTNLFDKIEDELVRDAEAGRHWIKEHEIAETTYPLTPGFQDSETSEAAAASMLPTAGYLRERICAELDRSGSFTADEMAFRLQVDRLSIRPRFTELYEMGAIEPTGEKRKNISGRNATVWRKR